MYIMALNCGSSSLKYQVFDATTKKQIVGGNVEKIGSDSSFVTQKYPDGTKQKKETPMKNHSEALNVVLFMLREASIDMNEIRGVGHRVVMGGAKFASSVEINDEVMHAIEEWKDLMPLHVPASLMGIESARQILPNATQVAVFDTAFLQTMPEYAYRYAIPDAWYRNLGVRRYGFHGTSHLYVSKRAAAMLGKPADQCNLITMHIGSGASGVAIKNGRAVDTTLGMTPTAGLVMGTRPGDVDAGALFYVMKKLNLTVDQMTTHMNKDSGLMGITKCFADRREVEQNRETNPDCELAIKIETHNVKKYIGAFMAELGHVDALVFTAGVGENDNYLRGKFCEGLEELGIKIDPEKNDKALARLDACECEISTPDSRVKVFMIPTNEELVIVEDTLAIMNKTYDADHLKMKYSFAN